jgi:protein phosphatase
MRFWNAIFGRSKKPGSRPETPPTAELEARWGNSEAPKFTIVASVQTDVGLVRDLNEDNASFTRPRDPGVLQSKGMLALVVDGMGGCSGGEVASGMAVASIPRAYYESPAEPHQALKRAFEEANRKIFDSAAEDFTLAGMGTTAVALAIRGDQAFAAYVGDSRLYLIRAARIYQMTQDHSVVFDLVRKGLLTPEEARNHEDRNVLLRSLGGRAEVEVSVWDEPMTIRDGDQFLLCSDGLHDLVDNSEILSGVLSGDDVPGLIGLAKERGGYDNITVALVRVQSAASGLPADAKATREIVVKR